MATTASSKKWPDGRAKVWFEGYNSETKMSLLSGPSIAKVLKDAKTIPAHRAQCDTIYEVHSRGGWDCDKDDKTVKVFDVIKGRAVRRNFKKGW